MLSTTEAITAEGREPLTYYEASQFPYHDGSKLNVMGKLMIPSQWQANFSTPRLVFSGDFVMEIET